MNAPDSVKLTNRIHFNLKTFETEVPDVCQEQFSLTYDYIFLQEELDFTDPNS